MTQARRDPARPINYADVEEVIGIAAELQDVEREQLSVEELAAVARDLDIPEHHLVPAVEELRKRRQAALAAEQAKARRRARALRAALIIAGVASVLVLGLGFSGQASLAGAHQEASRAHAQVVNVMERQRATTAQWRDLPHSEQRAAELSGAENRVRIERKRYDDAAAAYNARARSFPASLWARVFGFPEQLPLSHEIGSF